MEDFIETLLDSIGSMEDFIRTILESIGSG